MNRRGFLIGVAVAPVAASVAVAAELPKPEWRTVADERRARGLEETTKTLSIDQADIMMGIVEHWHEHPVIRHMV